MTGETVGLGYLVSLFVVIVAGAVMPVLPTGAAVSAAAALAEQDHLALIALVVAFGAAGAYVSDLATYAVIRYAGGRATDRHGWLARWPHGQWTGKALDHAQGQLEAHELRTLLLSRLVPGGQIPVLVAAGLVGYSWRRYALADIVPVAFWSAMYAATGIAGRAVFPRAWEGVAAGIVLVLLVSGGCGVWARLNARVAEA
ncbi:VTT domain-containing protein [Acidothermaceae bacterium B102]|nr:VTT domain-containing protein [Acidothermaceae bacterium B102]